MEKRNHSWINMTNTNIYVEPLDKREYENGFNISTLNLTWKAKSFYNNYLSIKLKFQNPLDLSPSIQQDKLIIQFNQSDNLINSLLNDKNIEQSQASTTMSANIPK